MPLPSIRRERAEHRRYHQPWAAGCQRPTWLNRGVVPSGAVVVLDAEGELWELYEYACTSATSIEAEGVVWIGTVWSDSSWVATWSSMMIS